MPSSLFLPLVNIYLTSTRGHGSMCCSCFVLADISNKFLEVIEDSSALVWYLGPKAL